MATPENKMDETENSPPPLNTKQLLRIEVWRTEVASAAASTSNPLTPTTTISGSGSGYGSGGNDLTATTTAPQAGSGTAIHPMPNEVDPTAERTNGAINDTSKSEPHHDLHLGRRSSSSSVTRFIHRVVTSFKERKKESRSERKWGADKREGLYESTNMYDADVAAAAAELGIGAAGDGVGFGELSSMRHGHGATAVAADPALVVNGHDSGHDADGEVNLHLHSSDPPVVSNSSDEKAGKGIRERGERLERAARLLDKGVIGGTPGPPAASGEVKV